MARLWLGLLPRFFPYLAILWKGWLHFGRLPTDDNSRCVRWRRLAVVSTATDRMTSKRPLGFCCAPFELMSRKALCYNVLRSMQTSLFNSLRTQGWVQSLFRPEGDWSRLE